MKNNTRNAFKDMARALKGVFQKYTLNTRQNAWELIHSKEGEKEIKNIILHPQKQLNRFAKLSFKEWVIEEANLVQLAKKSNIDLNGIDPEELKMGFSVEKEHGPKMGKDVDVTGGDSVKTLKIAIAHLREDPKYYTKLKKIEKYRVGY